MIPTENAPIAPIMESYGERDKVILGLEGDLLYQTDGDAKPPCLPLAKHPYAIHEKELNA